MVHGEFLMTEKLEFVEFDPLVTCEMGERVYKSSKYRGKPNISQTDLLMISIGMTSKCDLWRFCDLGLLVRAARR